MTDRSSAAVAGANVTLTSSALIVPQSMKTDQQGAYHFEQIPLGTYTLTVEQPGFTKFVRENIQIAAGFAAAVDVQLNVGQMQQTVEVSAAGPVVDTTSTQINTSISSNMLADDLPLTRTTKDFVTVAPGVTPTSAPNLSGGDVPSASYSAYGITGQSTMLIEGINTRKSSNSAEGDIDFPTLEEFQLVPTAGNAEVETPGLYINAIVKSGGNQFHGRVHGQGARFRRAGIREAWPALWPSDGCCWFTEVWFDLPRLHRASAGGNRSGDCTFLPYRFEIVFGAGVRVLVDAYMQFLTKPAVQAEGDLHEIPNEGADDVLRCGADLLLC